MTRVTLGKYETTRYRLQLPERDLETPVYIVGSPNTGKSTLLGNLAEQFAGLAGQGVLVLDIKGDLAHEIAARTRYPDKLIYFAPGECHFPGGQRTWALNPFEFDRHDRDAAYRMAEAIPALFERMGMADLSTMANIRQTLQATTQLALRDDEPTLLTLPLVLYHPPTRAQLLAKRAWPATKVYWQHDYEGVTPSEQRRKTTTTTNRFFDFLSSPAMNALVGTYRSTFRLREWLSEGKFVVCNLGTNLHRNVGIMIGNLIMATLVEATFARPDDGRRNTWRCVVDEFHLFVGDQFASIINEARSFKLFPVLAHQGASQLSSDAKRRAGDLLEAVGHAGVRYELSRGFEDGQERFAARLRYRTGPKGTPREERVLLLDWWGEPVPGQRQRAIATQENDRFTAPVADVYRRNSERYWDLMLGGAEKPAKPTKQGDGGFRSRQTKRSSAEEAAGPGPVRPEPGATAPTGDDPPRPAGAGGDRPPSLLDEFPGEPPLLPR
ncbi:MAG: type IV secretory system conjugative DNA transfer family protein [Chloroflexota bacterium]|nr:type IV secretory system conjugative DNA transfer family protein [Chloroflexota bacterium]